MDRFRVLVAGCGRMARTWVEYALSREDTKIVGLIDVMVESAQAMARDYKLEVPIFSDINAALDACDANLVFDITVPSSHREIVTSALRRSCDVFGEKPMGAAIEDAEVMMQVAKETGRTYAVMQNRRYNRQIRGFQELVSVIGGIGSIHADFFLGPHFGGFRDMMENPLILDMAIHTFDQARMLSGADPIAVYCHEFNPPGSWYKGNAGAVCLFEMSNGIVFCYRGMWCAEGAPTSWESEWRVTGSHGTAIWDGANDPYAEVVSNPSEMTFFRSASRVVPSFRWEGQNGHAGCLDEMFAALIEGRKAETDCTDNIKSTAMVFAAIESAKLQRKVLISVN